MRVARCLARLFTGILLLAVLVQCSPAPPNERTTVAQSAPAPKPQDEDGIGGTGRSLESPKPLDDQGIGGTGLSAEAPKPFDDDGIGGTGIIGVVTGFGSVIVNGHHVEFDPSTPISDPTGAVDPAALRIGHVVAIAAVNRNGALTAQTIFRRHPVAGPIEAIDRERGSVRVLGQSIVIVPATQIGSGLKDMAAGDTITVSGFRRTDGVVVATRIDKRSPSAPAILTAPIEGLDGRQIIVGALRIDRESLTGPAAPTPGSILTITGPIVDGRLVTATGRVRPRLPFAGRLQRLSIQGFAARDSEDRLQLQDLEIEGAKGSVSESALVTVEGRFSQGILNVSKFAIDALETLPLNQIPLNRLPNALPQHLKTLPDRIQGLDANRISGPSVQRPQLPPAVLRQNPQLPAAILGQPPQLPSAALQQLQNLPPAVRQQLPNLPPAVLQQLPNLPPAILQQLPNLPPEVLQQLPNLPPENLQQHLQGQPSSQ